MGTWMERGRARRNAEAISTLPAAIKDEDPTVSTAARNDQTTKPTPPTAVDPLRAWRWRNAELLTDGDLRVGHDAGGWCVEHWRWLTWPEQQRGACSWCVPVDPEQELEYWASHWQRYTREAPQA